MTSKKRAIGMILVGEDHQGLYSVHRVRDKINPESGQPESFPGALQPFVHGGLERNESRREGFLDALRREFVEELHEMFAQVGMEVPSGMRELLHISHQNLSVLVRENKEQKTVVTVQHSIDTTRRNLLTTLVSGGVIKVLREKDVAGIHIIDPKNSDQRRNGFSEGINAMFSDNLQAVRKVFERAVH